MTVPAITELRSCPFCGVPATLPGEAEGERLLQFTTEVSERKHWAITCMNCGARGPSMFSYDLACAGWQGKVPSFSG